jgi:hypothetical protein
LTDAVGSWTMASTTSIAEFQRSEAFSLWASPDLIRSSLIRPTNNWSGSFVSSCRFSIYTHGSAARARNTVPAVYPINACVRDGDNGASTASADRTRPASSAALCPLSSEKAEEICST